MIASLIRCARLVEVGTEARQIIAHVDAEEARVLEQRRVDEMTHALRSEQRRRGGAQLGARTK